MGVVFTLTVKEDYAIIFGPLGLWIAVFGGRALLPVSSFSMKASTKPTIDGQECPSSSRRTWLIVGIALCCFSVAYLWLATRVVMPWFRSGAEVHYVGYFKKLGNNPEEIVWNVFTNPTLWVGELFSISTCLYAMAMLAPVAFLPIFSPGRLAVGGPLFAILCLNELAKDPRHQFHAPLVAIVFWAVAGGLPTASTLLKRSLSWLRFRADSLEVTIPVLLRTALWSCSLTTGLFFSLGPLGLTFWDAGSTYYWRTLYGSSRRAEMFAHMPPQIPITSRVASTDFVHPRFTHYERSYDYSDYRRSVSNYERTVPDDTDFIVIDTQHPYSKITRPEEIPEYRDHPDQWVLLPDQTEGYFIVLKRR